MISAESDCELAFKVAKDEAPRKDYIELQKAVAGEILFRDQVRSDRLGNVIARIFGVATAQAVIAFKRRKEYDGVFTDAENIGIPLALLFTVTRTRRRHVMIGHLLTTAAKRPWFRLARVQRSIDVIICHASLQAWLMEYRLHINDRKIALIPYQVDELFWTPALVHPRGQICSAGLEFRDYKTLVEAVRGLDVDVVMAAASNWSRRKNEARDLVLPSNVRVTSLNYAELRVLYAESLFVVVPLHDVEFQAGITVILEAMAMGKAVVVTRARGQTDVVRDAQGLPSLPHYVHRAAGFGSIETRDEVGQTGIYVAPNDPTALRAAVQYLLDHPEEARRMGCNGRALVERSMTLEMFVSRIAMHLLGSGSAVSTVPKLT